MNNLEYSIRGIASRNRDGSEATQAARRDILGQASRQLRELGYKLDRASQLGSRHIDALVSHWRDQGIKVDTVKNRLTHVRWLAQKINKQNIVHRTNKEYGLDNRVQVDPVKARSKMDGYQRGDLNQISDRNVRMSAELQKAFGLRRSEGIKFRPAEADRGDHIALRGSWCKNGRPRTIPIRTAAQRDALDQAKALARFQGHPSMIPASRSYVQQVKVWERDMQQAGFSGTHGARNKYAADRYKELTGRECVARGGIHPRDMSKQQYRQDREARQVISREMGHERLDVIAVYLGG